MGHIFLSYAREDRAFAECAARVLEARGHTVWWDRHIDSGEEFAAQIEAELDKADVVLVGWSKLSVKSRWVRDEASVGGDTGRLVPVSVDGTRAPMGFRQFQTLDLTGWKARKGDERTLELLQAVDRRMKGKPGTPVAAVEQAPEPHWRSAFVKRPLAWGIAATLFLVIAAGTFLLLRAPHPPRGPLPKPTIALLPFTATSPDQQLRDVAAQARDALSHTLPQSGMPVRLLNSVPQDRRSAGDFLVSGEVSRSGDKIVATLRLDEAIHGVTVLSRRFEASHDQIGDLPERIGARMAAFFDGPALLVLDRRHPMDPTVMAELLVESDDVLENYQDRKRTAAKAPNDPNAQIGVAFFTGYALSQLPRSERPEAVMAARRAAERALALAPEFGDTYGSWCLLHSDARLAECEDQLRAGNRVDPDAPYLNGFLAGLMLAVGRFDEGAELARLSYTHNPYDHFKISGMLHLFEFAGDADGARGLYQNGIRWWPEQEGSFFHSRLWGLLERGDFAGMTRVEQEAGVNALPPNYQKSAPIADALRSKSVAALHRVCTDPQEFTLMVRCMVALAIAGDANGAYTIADKLYVRRVGRTPSETERIWLDAPDSPPLEFITSPGAKAMRGDARFLQLAERTGLLAYWRSGRSPDFCRPPQREPVCAQLLR